MRHRSTLPVADAISKIRLPQKKVLRLTVVSSVNRLYLLFCSQLLVFIFPSMREDRYTAIKRQTISVSPIATQVVISRNLQNDKKVRGVTQKIALQINCKLGGTLWSVRFPFPNWMICGIDVYHSPGSNKSVCGFVSSLNDSITRW